VTSTVGPSAAAGPRNIPPINTVVTKGRRGKGWLIAAVTSAGVICVALLVVGILHLVQSFKSDLGQAFGGLAQGGAAEALMADSIAKAHHIPDGALTPALLNAQHLDVKWISGGVPIAESDGGNHVSISAQGDHVATAMNISVCEYGLTVAAQSDPIIGADHLPTVGTYLAFSDMPGSTKACSADSAPIVGWVQADSSALRKMNAP
jgi:hypothetical protein